MSEEKNTKKKDFKKGDKLVRFGRVYEIYKVSNEEDPETGEKERYIHFQPVYETQANRSLVCAIPISNIDKTNIRQPMSEEEEDELLEMRMEMVEDQTKRFNTRQAKEVLKSNDPRKIALILKRLAVVRRDPDTNFTYTKKRIFRKGMKRLQEEIALVKKMELEETSQMLRDLLKKQAVKSLPLDEEED